MTNDGATILKSVHMDNPAGKVLVEISKTQDDEVGVVARTPASTAAWLATAHVLTCPQVGDGTTSVAVLAGELLRAGEKLLDECLHPQVLLVATGPCNIPPWDIGYSYLPCTTVSQTIVEGWRMAANEASRVLLESCQDHKDVCFL